MAITFIYKISSTGGASLNYDTADKHASIVGKDGENSLNYIMRDKREQDYLLSKTYLEQMGNLVKDNGDGTITFKTKTTCLRCPDTDTYKSWQIIRAQFGTDKKFGRATNRNGILQYCIVQNFGEAVDPAIAHEIGVRFANEYLKEYQVVVSTHINTGLIHNHIEFNATSLFGKKYNDCRQSIQDIRSISDALCDEYGLEVLEATREYNYIRYRDSSGKEKTYEPTVRKEGHLPKEVSDKNSYLNTGLYKSGVENTNKHAQTLKQDLDRFVLCAESYEDLLNMMKEVGYSITAKTKDGNWKSHITFKLDSWGKGVRDSKLGSEYEREVITERIAAAQHNSPKKPVPQIAPTQPLPEEPPVYKYGKKDIDSIDEDYFRRRKKSDHEPEIRERYEVEKEIIRATKETNKQLSIHLKQAMRPQRDERVVISNNKRTQYFIDRINQGLRTFRFVEEHNIKSLQQLNDAIQSLSDKRDELYKSASKIKSWLQIGNRHLEYIRRYNEKKPISNVGYKIRMVSANISTQSMRTISLFGIRWKRY